MCWCRQAGEEKALDSAWEMSSGETHCQQQGEWRGGAVRGPQDGKGIVP